MFTEEFETKYVAPLIAAGAAYEAVAITSKRLPTISAMVWWLYRRRWGQVILWVVWGWLTSHFFREMTEPEV